MTAEFKPEFGRFKEAIQLQIAQFRQVKLYQKAGTGGFFGVVFIGVAAPEKAPLLRFVGGVFNVGEQHAAPAFRVGLGQGLKLFEIGGEIHPHSLEDLSGIAAEGFGGIIPLDGIDVGQKCGPQRCELGELLGHVGGGLGIMLVERGEGLGEGVPALRKLCEGILLLEGGGQLQAGNAGLELTFGIGLQGDVDVGIQRQGLGCLQRECLALVGRGGECELHGLGARVLGRDQTLQRDVGWRGNGLRREGGGGALGHQRVLGLGGVLAGSFQPCDRAEVGCELDIGHGEDASCW